MVWKTGEPGFDTRCGQIFLFATSQLFWDSSEPHPGLYFLAPGRKGSFSGGEAVDLETDHPPPPSAEVKNAWIYTSTPPYAFFMPSFFKHRDKLTVAYVIVDD
jgi:hypothetical protein